MFRPGIRVLYWHDTSYSTYLEWRKESGDFLPLARWFDDSGAFCQSCCLFVTGYAHGMALRLPVRFIAARGDVKAAKVVRMFVGHRLDWPAGRLAGGHADRVHSSAVLATAAGGTAPTHGPPTSAPCAPGRVLHRHRAPAATPYGAAESAWRAEARGRGARNHATQHRSDDPASGVGGDVRGLFPPARMERRCWRR